MDSQDTASKMERGFMYPGGNLTQMNNQVSAMLFQLSLRAMHQTPNAKRHSIVVVTVGAPSTVASGAIFALVDVLLPSMLVFGGKIGLDMLGQPLRHLCQFLSETADRLCVHVGVNNEVWHGH